MSSVGLQLFIVAECQTELFSAAYHTVSVVLLHFTEASAISGVALCLKNDVLTGDCVVDDSFEVFFVFLDNHERKASLGVHQMIHAESIEPMHISCSTV